MDNRNVIINPHNNLLAFEEHLYALQDVKRTKRFPEPFSL